MLQTKRLKLRQFVENDKPTVIGLLKNPDFMAYSPTGAMTDSQAEHRFNQLIKAFDEEGIGKLAIIEKSSGNLIRYCGIESFDYKSQKVVELGYRLKLSARGYGYAFEACKAILYFAKQLGYLNILALTEVENAQSQHILSKLGFEAREKGTFQGMSIQYFEKNI
ncbi:GNAT family N-acetyltransferase [Zooshikella marina]|uniref:GNAT family N-acetyltransferase n=1 Tax=Zooshikella ganghwensis TaxID=202772 RepID=UPI001BAECAD4|nr:GNAT family N-acetyltransferase [Zooshikella ganghwensis]MBU2707116.1 GNAT family N-acetyltransferase [Zooshikella ganghwensis]